MGTYMRLCARAGMASVLVSLFLAIALACCFAPSYAFSAEGTAGSATLQISRGVDSEGNYSSDISKTYEFYKDATIEDLLKAAVAAGDIQSYELNEYGFPAAITFSDGASVKNADDWSVYWSSSIDGNARAVEFDTGNYSSIALVDGKIYQLVLTSYPPPDDYSFFENPTPSTQTAGTPQVDDETNQNDDQASSQDDQAGTATSPEQTSPSETDAIRVIDENSLFDAIAASYIGTADFAQALDLARACLLTASKDSLVEAALQTVADPPTGSLVRAILALNAHAIDPTAVPNGSDTTDLVAALAQNAAANDGTYISIPAFTLLAYECGPYDVPSDALKSKEELKSMLLASQNDNGSYGYGDVDTTAMVLAALAPYYNADTNVKDSVDKGLENLKSQQLSDGGFGSSYGNAATSNANSTASVVIALCALGIDPAKQWATSSGQTPYNALLQFATEDVNAFTYDGTTANDYATEQGFAAMVAYRGLQKKGSAYNLYLDDVCTQNINTSDDAGKKDAEEQKDDDKKSLAAPASNTAPHQTAKTADTQMPYLVSLVVLLLALAALRGSLRKLSTDL